MDLTPQHLRRVEFREKWRGYDPDEVDDYLERVAAVFELLQERLRQATERAQETEGRLSESREADDQLRRTLLLAQRTADATTQEARDEAARVVAEAEQRAQELVHEAEERARRRVQDAESELRGRIAALETARDRLQDDANALERYLAEARGAIERALRQELSRLRELAGGVPAKPAMHRVDVPEPVAADAPAEAAEPAEAAATVPADDAAPAGDEGAAAPPPWFATRPPEPADHGTDAEAGPEAEADADADGGEPTAAWSFAEHVERAEDAPAPGAPVTVPVPGAAVPGVAEGEVDYFPDLREAMNEQTPLGPREDEGEEGDDDGVYEQDLPEGGRFRSILRRRHD